MITDSLGEFFWKKVKFVLLFLVCGTGLYIVSQKYIFEIPNTDNTELLSSIRGYEEVLEKQTESKEQIQKIFEQIKEMEFDIHQVQVQDEVTKRISQVRKLYKDYELNSKFKFSIISADLMVLYFNTKQGHSSLIKNKAKIEENLMACKANF
ncbi:MAG: type VI secretion system TssO [Crocinitomicaceae bacterium]|nr:type VI secretion system TssO [Crocinitomicaceae bacterium]